MTVVSTMVGLLWRRLLRDRLALVFTFALPVALSVVMVTIYADDDQRVGVVAGSGSEPVADALVDELGRSGLVTVARYEDRASLEQAVRRREVAAGVIVPADALAGGSTPGGTTTIELVGAPGIEAPSGVRAVVEAAVAETAAAAQVGRAAAPDARPAEQLRVGGDALDGRVPRQRFDERTAAERRRASAAAALAGTLVLFVFTNTLGGSASLAEMRDLGVLGRLRTTPASPAALTVGYGLGFASYAAVQTVLMLATARLLFGVTWASWPAMAVILLLATGAAAALAVLVATVLPSADMGTTVAGPLGFVLGMLGGCLWPLEIVGPTLQRLGRLTPQAWAVEGIRATGIDGGGLAEVATPVAVLAAGTALTVAVAAWRLARVGQRA